MDPVEYPLEVFDMILHYMEWSDVKELLLVSKTWNRMVFSLLARRNISTSEIRTIPKCFVENYFDTIVDSFPNCLENDENLNMHLVGHFPNLLQRWDRFWKTLCCTVFIDPIKFQTLVENLPHDDIQVGTVDINYICLEISKNFYKDSRSYLSNLKSNIAFIVQTFPKSVRSFLTRSKTSDSFPSISTALYLSIILLCCSMVDVINHMFKESVNVLFLTMLKMDVNKDIGPQNEYDVIQFVNLVVETSRKSNWDRNKIGCTRQIWDLFFGKKINKERKQIYKYLCKIHHTTLIRFVEILFQGDSSSLRALMEEFPFHRVDPSLAQSVIKKLLTMESISFLSFFSSLLGNPRSCNIGSEFMKHLLVIFAFKCEKGSESKVDKICNQLFGSRPDLYDQLQIEEDYQIYHVIYEQILCWDQWWKEKEFLQQLYTQLVSENFSSFITNILLRTLK